MLVISTQAPYHSSSAIDAIEAALAASNVGLQVQFVLQGDGVYQLSEAQKPDAISHKNISKQLKALPLYDIEDIYVCESESNAGRLRIINSAPFDKHIEQTEMQRLIREAKHVLVF